MASIDILLPVKNGMEFLAESVDSILAQTVADWRLLILDHGSSDGSQQLAQSYATADSRIELHSFPEAPGLSGLLNCGLAICNAELIMRHDADDICYPNRMEIMLKAFAENPDCVAIGGQADVIDGKGNKTGEMTLPLDSEHIAAAAMFYNPMAHPTITLRHAAVMEMGIRYGVDFLRVLPESERMEVPALAEDYFLFGQLALLGKCKNVPDKLIRYRWHTGNVSATKFAEQMKVSISIARYLARCFSILHKLAEFDPAPFSSLGGQLTAITNPKQSVLDEGYERMAELIRCGFGSSNGLDRELSFRRVTGTRNTARMVWRYAQFRSRNTPVSIEWGVVRNSLIAQLKSFIKFR
jgi:glycosyltransferase involved in cell wall biosynthesis